LAKKFTIAAEIYIFFPTRIVEIYGIKSLPYLNEIETPNKIILETIMHKNVRRSNFKQAPIIGVGMVNNKLHFWE